jgi:hypothetical protein
MTNIPEHEERTSFVNDLFFERSGRLCDDAGKLAREELIDLCMHLLGELDKIDNTLEKLVNQVNVAQGYEKTHTAL